MGNAEGTSVHDWSRLMAKAERRRQVLLMWIARQAQADGYSLLALAHVLGVSRSYLYALYSGQSDTATVGDKVIEALAQYLRKPPVVVRCAAGQIRLDDFFTGDRLYEAASTVQRSLMPFSKLHGQLPSIVLAYAGVVAGIDLVSRRQLRDLVADGPIQKSD